MFAIYQQYCQLATKEGEVWFSASAAPDCQIVIAATKTPSLASYRTISSTYFIRATSQT